MKPSLLSWLRCPDCNGAPLALDVFARDAGAQQPDEVLEGLLTCRCGAPFPIIQGVPRLLPRDLRAVLPRTYAAFYSTYGDRLRGVTVGSASGGKEMRGQVHVMEAFGFEWNEFADYGNDNFDEWIAPLRPDFFRGKLGVDAGCGAGRHARRAHDYGAEVVAMDLSPAVDAAYAKARATARMHVLQGDIFNPPLVPGTFDFVYSLGVLHHTPDPPRAFRSLVPLLRAGGTIAAMLYASGRPVALSVLAAVRQVTVRLPLPATKALSWTAAALDTAGPIALYRGLRRLGVPGAALRRVTPEHVRIYADLDFPICYTDWLDRLSYPYVHYYGREDVWQWFMDAGLERVTVRPLGVHGWTGVGNARRRPAAPTPNGAVRGRELCAG